MRIIYSSTHPKEAETLSNFLKSKGIQNNLETNSNHDWGNPDYGITTSSIWVIEEDTLEDALKWKDAFEKNPKDPQFDIPESKLQVIFEPIKESAAEGEKLIKLGLKNGQENRRMGPLTLYTLIFCILLFFFSGSELPNIEKFPENIPAAPLVTPSGNKILMYDYPQAFELTDELVSRFGIDKVQNPALLPEDGQALVAKINKTPYWQGIYSKIVAYLQNHRTSIAFTEPMFEKIHEGQVWRLVTPIFLHGSLLHLIFNMILFVILGKQIERKIGFLKFFLFIAITAIFSNTVQYLMSGSNFVGISGVICAMIGFVFMRQKKAAWEGYQFTSISLSSVVVFIALMFFLQLIAFFTEIVFNESLSPNIANAAHISGLFIGFLLGRLNFFKLQES